MINVINSINTIRELLRNRIKTYTVCYIIAIIFMFFFLARELCQICMVSFSVYVYVYVKQDGNFCNGTNINNT